MRQPDYFDADGTAHYLSDGKTDPVTVYSWRVRDPERRSGWRDLTWKMTPTEAEAWAESNARELERIQGTAEVRIPLHGYG